MKKAKQILAALLCLCMVVAVIPVAAPQAAAAVGSSVVFHFGGSNGAPTGAGAVGSAASNWTMIAKSDTLDWTTWGSWKHTQIESPNAGDYVALKVNIPEGGVYSTVANVYDWHSFGHYNIHMIPYTEGMDIASAIKSYVGFIGTAGKSDRTSGEGYADCALYDATLNAGDYILAFELKATKNDSVNGYQQLSGKLYGGPATLTFTKKADLPAASVEATTYEISAQTATSGTWEKMSDLSSVDAATTGWWNYYAAASTTEQGAFVTFKLKGLKEGSYKANALNYQYRSGCDQDYYLVSADTSKDAIAALTSSSTAYIGRGSSYDDDDYTATELVKEEVGEIGIPADGDYLLVIKAADRAYSGKYYMNIRGVEMVRYGEYVAPAEPSNFGDHYAYMTKIGDKCVLTVIGGIKEIDGYSEVGFELSINGGAMSTKQGGANVYETINYEGAAIDTSKLGADVEYLFYETFEMSAADFAGVTSLKFKAYAEGEETEYGAEYELPLN